MLNSNTNKSRKNNKSKKKYIYNKKKFKKKKINKNLIMSRSKLVEESFSNLQKPQENEVNNDFSQGRNFLQRIIFLH